MTRATGDTARHGGTAHIAFALFSITPLTTLCPLQLLAAPSASGYTGDQEGDAGVVPHVERVNISGMNE